MEGLTAIVELPAAAWPVALSVAGVLAGGRVRQSRRRARLNRGLHELRRPLQALALAQPPGAGRQPLEQALTALSDLDGEINDERVAPRRRPVACRALVESAVERWRAPAARAERAIAVRWEAGDATVLADPVEIARALDNLLANAIEHGGISIHVAGTACERGVRISISNGAAPPGPTVRFLTLSGERPRPDRRRGHGLAIVGQIAAAHEGRFAIHRGARGALAVLELPLAPPAPSAA